MERFCCSFMWAADRMATSDWEVTMQVSSLPNGEQVVFFSEDENAVSVTHSELVSHGFGVYEAVRMAFARFDLDPDDFPDLCTFLCRRRRMGMKP